MDTIPAPLLDRMEIIRLSGYITSEKLKIVKNHLLPRVLQKAGLKRSQLKVDKAALTEVIEGYARAAGVRLTQPIEKAISRDSHKSIPFFDYREHLKWECRNIPR